MAQTKTAPEGAAFAIVLVWLGLLRLLAAAKGRCASKAGTEKSERHRFGYLGPQEARGPSMRWSLVAEAVVAQTPISTGGAIKLLEISSAKYLHTIRSRCRGDAPGEVGEIR